MSVFWMTEVGCNEDRGWLTGVIQKFGYIDSLYALESSDCPNYEMIWLSGWGRAVF